MNAFEKATAIAEAELMNDIRNAAADMPRSKAWVLRKDEMQDESQDLYRAIARATRSNVDMGVFGPRTPMKIVKGSRKTS